MDNICPERTKGNLLIVDDELSSRQTLKALLIGEGHGVGCAASEGMALPFCEHFYS